LTLINSFFSILFILNADFHLHNAIIQVFGFVIRDFFEWDVVQIVEYVVGSIRDDRSGVGECVVEGALGAGGGFVRE